MGYGGKQAIRSGDIRRFNFTGNGSNTAFDLGFAPATQNQLIVTVNGLVQHYDAFSITGSTLTFTGTPASGDTIQVTAVVDAVGVAAIPDGAIANVSSLAVSGAATLSNTVAITGAATFSNTVAVTGSLTTTSNVHTIGTAFSTDANGAIGIGITPKAWQGYKAIQYSSGTNAYGSLSIGTYLSNSIMDLATNYYNDATLGDTYIGNGYSAKYRQYAGTHRFYVANSGTANTSSTFNEVLTINNSGQITTPYQPAFVVTKNGGASGTLTANTVLDFSYAVSNRGNHYNTSTYRFTAPVAGYYKFYVHLYHNNTSGNLPNGAVSRIMIKKNGVELHQGTDVIPHAYVQGTGADDTSSTSIIFDMAVNDYVTVAVRSGQTGCFYGGHSLFYGYLIG